MSAGYKAILWNPQKKRYDLVFVTIIICYLVAYFSINTLLYPTITFETMLIRSFGTLAFIMLHVILSIGPLSRINSKFLVLLYNRRHLGVTMFLMASVHALFSIFQFHANGNINPILSVFVSNTHYGSFLFFPFQTLGFAAYIILTLMAFTSHDFWLSVLSPRIWKTLHMLVYIAYFLLILHVLLGVIQLESSPVYFVMLFLGVIWIAGIHAYAGYKEWKFDHKSITEKDGWVKVGHVNEIEDNKAKMIIANSERIAVFKSGNKLSAVHNVCKHQNGPLGEGKIVDGCITCPWHGYQYQPADGCSPPPFTEKVATYQTKLIGKEVWINPVALPEGTFIEPTFISPDVPGPESKAKGTPFYIGWQPKTDSLFGRFARKTSALIAFMSLVAVVLISLNQKHIAPSYFIFNDKSEYSGQLVLKPFPALRTVAGKDVYGNPVFKTYPLINAWKFGADSLVKQVLESADAVADVKLKGDILTRDSVEEIVLDYGPSSIQITHIESLLDKVNLTTGKDTIIHGEIIDPKCYFGAMNPGEGKPHRSCAIRCIEGGIMPMVTFTNREGKPDYAVILGDRGQKLNDKIGYSVAEPVQLRGKLFKMDNWKILEIALPSGVTRTTITASN